MSRTLKNIAFILSVAAAISVWFVYRTFFFPNTNTESETVYLLIPDDTGFTEVCDSIVSKGFLVNERTFKLTAKIRKYPSAVKPGRYLIDNKMSNWMLVNRLRAGIQAPVKVTFNNIRTIYEFAGRIGPQIEADSASIADFLLDSDNYSADGFTRETVMAVFIPDTYELYWSTTAEAFYKRMLKEYERFWDNERLTKATEKGFTPVEVSIIASIVDDEVAKSVEKPIIAGVYLNRLRIGMPLQACPTIKFALNDFTITRVLYEHTQVESPYNTYKHRGLPPGPVRFATISGIDAVLNAEKHNYLFFAAKADFSGYHNFSRTLAEHNRYANAYQRELDRRRIYR